MLVLQLGLLFYWVWQLGFLGVKYQLLSSSGNLNKACNSSMLIPNGISSGFSRVVQLSACMNSITLLRSCLVAFLTHSIFIATGMALSVIRRIWSSATTSRDFGVLVVVNGWRSGDSLKGSLVQADI